MNRWVLFGLIIGSTIAIALPVYHYRDFTNQPLIGNYLFAGLIIEGIIVFLIQNHVESKRHFLDKREKHTYDLVEKTYSKLVDVQIYQKKPNEYGIGYPHNFGDYITQKIDPFAPTKEITFVPYILHISEPYLTWGLKHLENYNDVYKHWKEANSLLTKYNESLRSFREIVNKEIKRVIGIYFVGFTDYIVEPDKNYYKLFSINELIYHTLRNTILTDPIFQLEKTNHEMSYIESKGFGILIQSKNEIDLELFRNCLGIIYDNVIKSFNDLDFKRDQTIKELSEFTDNLTTLVSELNAGMIIEGRCKLPY